MWQKVMDKEATKQIRETRREKKYMQVRKATTTMIVAK